MRNPYKIAVITAVTAALAASHIETSWVVESSTTTSTTASANQNQILFFASFYYILA